MKDREADQLRPQLQDLLQAAASRSGGQGPGGAPALSPFGAELLAGRRLR